MPRGDYIDIIYRTGTEYAKERVEAKAIGGGVSWDEPRANELFLVAREINKTGATVRKATFAKGDVIAVLEGNVGPQKQKAAKK